MSVPQETIASAVRTSMGGGYSPVVNHALSIPVLVGAVVAACSAPAVPSAAADAEPPAQSEPDGERMSQKLLSSVTAAAPGSSFTLALSCRVAKGWHTYWPGLNDTGAPASIEFSLPAGWTAGEPQWPAPTRHVSPGDLVDYALEGDFTVLVEVQVPRDAAVGATHEVSVAAGWLVCKNVCVMESRTSTATIRVEKAMVASPDNAELIGAARKKLPEATVPAGLELKVNGREFSATWQGASSMEFCPLDSAVSYENLLKDGASDSATLRVKLGEFPNSARVEGVVVGVFGADRKAVRRAVRVSLPVPGDEPEAK